MGLDPFEDLYMEDNSSPGEEDYSLCLDGSPFQHDQQQLSPFTLQNSNGPQKPGIGDAIYQPYPPGLNQQELLENSLANMRNYISQEQAYPMQPSFTYVPHAMPTNRPTQTSAEFGAPGDEQQNGQVCGDIVQCPSIPPSAQEERGGGGGHGQCKGKITLRYKCGSHPRRQQPFAVWDVPFCPATSKTSNSPSTSPEF